MPRVLVAYDIGNNKIRENFANFLQAHGLVRIQRSLFIGKVSSQTIKDIERKAAKIIDLSRDVVHIVPLSIYEYQHMKTVGTPFNKLQEGRIHVIM